MITALLINFLFGGNVQSYIIFHMLTALTINVFLLYYPNFLVNYLKNSGEIITNKLMTDTQFYRMLWTVFYIGQAITLTFLLSIGYEAKINTSLYVGLFAVSGLTIYVWNTIMSQIKE